MAHPIIEHIPRLRRYARALVGHSHRADDLVQDTLERAYTKWHLWREGTNLRAWLFTVMHNVWANQMESGNHVPPMVSIDEALDIADLPRQDGALGIRDLEAALITLPGDQREVLLLVALEDLKYHEAARVLDVPIGTVMSRLARARAKLRFALSEGAVKRPNLKAVK
ncbi:MAG: sigma-70 family RNA polymerase sigma factor [Burkholderiales bacterium]